MNEEEALAAIERDHKRAIADVIVTMEAVGWRHGWLLGFITGTALTALVCWLCSWLGFWLWLGL